MCNLSDHVSLDKRSPDEILIIESNLHVVYDVIGFHNFVKLNTEMLS